MRHLLIALFILPFVVAVHLGRSGLPVASPAGPTAVGPAIPLPVPGAFRLAAGGDRRAPAAPAGTVISRTPLADPWSSLGWPVATRWTLAVGAVRSQVEPFPAEQGAAVDRVVVAGEVQARLSEPARVVWAAEAPTTVPAGTDLRLGPGDMVEVPGGALARWENHGRVPAGIVDVHLCRVPGVDPGDTTLVDLPAVRLPVMTVFRLTLAPGEAVDDPGRGAMVVAAAVVGDGLPPDPASRLGEGGRDAAPPVWAVDPDEAAFGPVPYRNVGDRPLTLLLVAIGPARVTAAIT